MATTPHISVVPNPVGAMSAIPAGVPFTRPDTSAEWEPLMGLINVLDYGADPTGVTDSTAAIQNAVDDLTNFQHLFEGAYEGLLIIPAGLYKISDTILVDGVMGATIRGSGQWSTRFVWYTGADRPAFRLRNCRVMYLERFSVKAMSGSPTAIIQIERDSTVPSALYSTSGNCLYGMGLDGNNRTQFGILVTYTALDAGNDFNEFERIESVYMLQADAKLVGTQSKGNKFEMCHFLYGTRGVWVPDGGGHFSWRGGFLAGHSVSDFVVHSPLEAVDIRYFDSEGSARLLDMGGDTGNPCPVIIENGRFMTNGLHADRYMIKGGPSGSYIIRGNQLGSSGHAVPRMYFGNTSAMEITLEDNAFNALSSDAEDPIVLTNPGVARVRRRGNQFRNAGNFIIRKDGELRTIGAAGEPVFNAGWSNAAGAVPLHFWKTDQNDVHVNGLITHGAGARNELITQLPAGYRPSADIYGGEAYVASGAAASAGVKVNSEGALTAYVDDTLNAGTCYIRLNLVFRATG